MSANANAKIIRIKQNVEKEYFFSPDSSRCYLQDSAELQSKSSNRSNTDLTINFDCNTILIKIDSQNTHVVIENNYPLSTPLHVHTIAHQNGEVSCYTIFVIFDDHILRIRLENSEFVECKTETFYISSELLQSIKQDSFSAIDDGQNLRAHFVVDNGYFYDIESYKLYLENDGDSLFHIDNGLSFRIPSNIDNIQINGECIEWMIKSKGKRTKISISLFDGKVDSNGVPLYLFAQNRYYEDPKTQNTVTSCEGFHISTSDQLDRFQGISFEIVATMYVCPFEDHDDLPEIQAFIKAFLELNKYRRC